MWMFENTLHFFTEKWSTPWHRFDQSKLPDAESMRLSLWIKSKSYLGIAWWFRNPVNRTSWGWENTPIVSKRFINSRWWLQDFWTINSSDSIWEAYDRTVEWSFGWYICWKLSMHGDTKRMIHVESWFFVGYPQRVLFPNNFWGSLFLLTSPNNSEDLRFFHFLVFFFSSILFSKLISTSLAFSRF